MKTTLVLTTSLAVLVAVGATANAEEAAAKTGETQIGNLTPTCPFYGMGLGPRDGTGRGLGYGMGTSPRDGTGKGPGYGMARGPGYKSGAGWGAAQGRPGKSVIDQDADGVCDRFQPNR